MTELRRKRKAEGLTMVDLAIKARVPYQTLCRYERGYARPSLQTARKLATALSAEISELFPDVSLRSLGGE